MVRPMTHESAMRRRRSELMPGVQSGGTLPQGNFQSTYRIEGGVMRACLALVISSMFAASCVFSMAEQTLRTQKESFPAAAVSTVRLETGAGSLTVTGQEGVTAIDVIAEFKANVGSENDAKRILDNLKLTMEIRGNTFYLKTEQRNNWHWGDSGRIDISIVLPSRLPLDVEDGSGGISIKGVDGDIVIDDGSGEIEIDGVRGNLTIQDGSGEIRIRNAARDLEIEDGSGGIDIRHVGGNVRIEDGSGSMSVEDVNGSLVVPSDGSGSIHYADVRGKINIPRRK
jgi:DUF4097 and DUF4098 domain-containing protein YvlB